MTTLGVFFLKRKLSTKKEGGVIRLFVYSFPAVCGANNEYIS